MNSFGPDEPDNTSEDFDAYLTGARRPDHPGPNGEWNPYQSSDMESRPVIYQSQTVSALSILSLISGLLSVPLICLCFLSLPFSLFAIVSGHISRSICRSSQGRVSGDGMAVAGLVLGYTSFLMTAGMFVLWGVALNSVPKAARPVAVPATPTMTALEPDEELDQAVALLSFAVSSGRTQEATELAQHLQAALHLLARQLATEESSGVETRGAVVAPPPDSSDIVAELPEQSASGSFQRGLSACGVFCELHEDSCAFLIHILDLSELSEADREQLAKLAWLAAGRTLDGNREEGCELAIGFVSNGKLTDIGIGHFQQSDQFDAGLQYRGPADNPEARAAFAEFFATRPEVEETIELEMLDPSPH